jgi:D-glycero-D-manno-heptose 1,7-bisphosphate phosphatase
MHPAVFLDRDGVIIENRASYVLSWADVSFIPLAREALAAASASPYRFVIVTNQSAVGRGLLSYSEAVEINNGVIRELVRYGGRIDGAYICPHTPQDHCGCRKPGPGLLLQASQELSLDLSRSVMIGDALSDLQAGQSAGVSRTILLKTGRGAEQARLPLASTLGPFEIFPGLADALAALPDPLP